MAENTARPGSPAGAAACASAFVCALTISLSAPSLTDPVFPGLAFVVLFPAVLAGLIGLLLGRLRFIGDPRVAAVASSVAVSLPWLLVAGAGLARYPWMLWLGLVLATVLPLWMLRARLAGPLAFALALAFCSLPKGDLHFGRGELQPLVVVGMDSANWRFIEEMIAENPDDLPALQELRQRGAWAPLHSETPSASARIWTILATGVTDEENGIKNFGNRRSDLRAGRVWDAVIEPREGEAAGTAGVVAWLINTPPDTREGLVFNTPGWVTGIREARPAAATPAKVLEGMGEDTSNRPGVGELLGALRSSMAVASADHAWKHVEVAFELVFGKLFLGFGKEDLTWRMKIMRDRINADLFFELAKRSSPDFGAVVLYATDQLGHFFWKYHEVKHGDPSLFPSVKPVEAKRRGEAVRDAYRACDEQLARLLEQADLGEIRLMLISDHGMQPLPEERDDKLLKLKGGALLVAAGGGPGDGEVLLDAFTTSNVDKALYISAKAEGADGRRQIEELRTLLEGARNVTMSQPLFTLSFPDNTVQASLRVDFLKQNKDSLQMDHQVQVGDVLGVASDLFEVETRSGRHHLDGFFLLAGPGIREGAKLESVSIYDMAPTMLHAMGKAVPAALTGRVVTEAFTAAELAARPVRQVAGGLPLPPEVRSATEAEEASEQQALIDSGYLTDDDKS